MASAWNGRNQFTGSSDIEERFWSRVNKSDDCWLWEGAPDKNGYGKFQYSTRNTRRATIVAWELTYGLVPEGLWVLHTCDTPRCVRPTHLYVGTARQNSADRDNRGRANSPKGTRNGMAKLNEDEVEIIRFLYASGKFSQAALGASFNVTQATVWRVVAGRLWV